MPIPLGTPCVTTAAEVQARRPAHHHPRHGVHRQGRGDPRDPQLAQREIGRRFHIGDKNTIRAHEGSLRFSDKVVLGRDNVINPHLDIELGDGPDGRLVLRLRFRPSDGRHQPADQGSGHHQIADWDRAGHLGRAKSVRRGTSIGRGCVLDRSGRSRGHPRLFDRGRGTGEGGQTAIVLGGSALSALNWPWRWLTSNGEGCPLSSPGYPKLARPGWDVALSIVLLVVAVVGWAVAAGMEFMMLAFTDYCPPERCNADRAARSVLLSVSAAALDADRIRADDRVSGSPPAGLAVRDRDVDPVRRG